MTSFLHLSGELRASQRDIPSPRASVRGGPPLPPVRWVNPIALVIGYHKLIYKKSFGKINPFGVRLYLSFEKERIRRKIYPKNLLHIVPIGSKDKSNSLIHLTKRHTLISRYVPLPLFRIITYEVVDLCYALLCSFYLFYFLLPLLLLHR